jgi:hypothetical protein
VLGEWGMDPSPFRDGTVRTHILMARTTQDATLTSDNYKRIGSGYEKQNCTMDSLGRGHGYLYSAYSQWPLELAERGDYGCSGDLVHSCAQDPFQTTIGIENG